MIPPELFTKSKKPVRLDVRIGKGGEGDVYAVAGSSDDLVKIYTVSNPQSRAAKIAGMIEAKLFSTSSLIAFPIEAVFDKAGTFAGFTMKRVMKHHELHELYPPGARKKTFPEANYKFVVHAATNIARALAVAHKAGCVIGDINPSGILISQNGTAALIDADSFQITIGSEKHICKVGVPNYTPPELQGLRLDLNPRETNHDNFGLAVIIFQLLWMGRHPFSGRPDTGEMPIERAIKEFRFAYSKRSVGMKPPPAVPALSEFPPQIASAFEDAFGPGGAVSRPSAAQWVALLQELGSGLRSCGVNGLHHYPASAIACPWCRMEQQQGVQLFLPKASAFSASAVGEGSFSSAEIEKLWKAIEGIAFFPEGHINPAMAPVSPEPSIAAKNVPAADRSNKWLGGIIAIGGIALLFVLPALAVIAIGMIVFGFVLFNIDKKADGNFISKAVDAEKRWLAAQTDWQRSVGNDALISKKNALLSIKSDIENLVAAERRAIEQFEQKRRSEQLKSYLEKYQIRRHKIPGVGPSKQATLTSYGIDTAADISPTGVQRVPGFGPVNSRPLIEWRLRCERSFRYRSEHDAAEKASIAAIRSGFFQRSRELHSLLAKGPSELSEIRAGILRRRGTPDAGLQRIHEERMQAQADLTYLGLKMPHVHYTPPPKPASAPSASAKPTATSSGTYTPAPPSGGAARSRQATTCPTCGGGMRVRTAKRGSRAGSQFYGCNRYPVCKGTRPYP